MSSLKSNNAYHYGGFGNHAERAGSIYDLLNDHQAIRSIPEEREKRIIREMLDESLKKKLSRFKLKGSQVQQSTPQALMQDQALQSTAAGCKDAIMMQCLARTC